MSPRDRLSFLVEGTIKQPADIAPSPLTAALDLRVCLAQGTPQGDYPISFERGEFVEAVTSRSVQPTLGSLSLTVFSDVTASESCTDPPPPPPPSLNASYELVGGTAPPGQTVDLTFKTAKTPIGERNITRFTPAAFYRASEPLIPPRRRRHYMPARIALPGRLAARIQQVEHIGANLARVLVPCVHPMTVNLPIGPGRRVTVSRAPIADRLMRFAQTIACHCRSGLAKCEWNSWSDAAAK